MTKTKQKESSQKSPVCPSCKAKMVLIYVGFQQEILSPVWICACPPLTKQKEVPHA